MPLERRQINRHLCGMKLLIKNIKGLVGARETAPGILRGAMMNDLPVIEDAWLAVEDGRIADFGTMADWPGISDWRGLEVIEADGRWIFPGWVDSHTHLVHAGSREGEFVDRINGLSYSDIAERGGGILNSARRLREADEEQLFDEALERAWRMIAQGTLAIEIKSGYGLTPESELKMLRVATRLKESLPVPVKRTFLGAHAIHENFKGDSAAYVAHVVKDMLPLVADQGLADYIDVFCEKGYFSLADTELILSEGARYGLRGKVHVNQFNAFGAVALCAKYKALSVDHLEVMTEEDIASLKASNVLPVALPGCSFFLSIPYTPANELIAADLPVVLASDYNPGSAPSYNMNTVLSLACIKMKMTPEQAVNAATVNAAAALELEHERGSISPGMKADFFLTKAMPSLAYLPYSFGDSLVDQVFIGGKNIHTL